MRRENLTLMSERSLLGTRLRRLLAFAGIGAVFLLYPALRVLPGQLSNEENLPQTLEIPQLRQHTPSPNTMLQVPRSQVIEIPQRFLGCWRGDVTAANIVDLQMLSPPRIDGWLTKRYKVCFVRNSDNILVATMVDSSVEPHYQVLKSSSVLRATGAGNDWVDLAGSLRMVEQTGLAFGVPIGPIAVVDEKVKLHGRLVGKDTMIVEGEVRGYYNSRPWWICHWTCNFRHVS